MFHQRSLGKDIERLGRTVSGLMRRRGVGRGWRWKGEVFFVCSINCISGMCLWGRGCLSRRRDQTEMNDRINRPKVGGLGSKLGFWERDCWLGNPKNETEREAWRGSSVDKIRGRRNRMRSKRVRPERRGWKNWKRGDGSNRGDWPGKGREEDGGRPRKRKAGGGGMWRIRFRGPKGSLGSLGSGGFICTLSSSDGCYVTVKGCWIARLYISDLPKPTSHSQPWLVWLVCCTETEPRFGRTSCG